jgi:hypothetical protein
MSRLYVAVRVGYYDRNWPVSASFSKTRLQEWIDGESERYETEEDGHGGEWLVSEDEAFGEKRFNFRIEEVPVEGPTEHPEAIDVIDERLAELEGITPLDMAHEESVERRKAELQIVRDRIGTGEEE